MGKDDLKCPICGEPTFVYFGNPRKDRLCAKHGKMANAGEIEQCPICGKWHNADEDCECMSDDYDEEESTCIICGKPSNGYYFCKDCYYSYRNKTILVKIKNCEIPCGEPLDESYEGVYQCIDGHIVKSMGEQTIDNWLFRNKIFHAYEAPLSIGKNKNPIKPDFKLINYLGEGKDVYLEYFGMEGDPNYDETTAYKIQAYKEQKITLICLYRKTDGNNLEWALQEKLINTETANYKYNRTFRSRRIASRPLIRRECHF